MMPHDRRTYVLSSQLCCLRAYNNQYIAIDVSSVKHCLIYVHIAMRFSKFENIVKGRYLNTAHNYNFVRHDMLLMLIISFLLRELQSDSMTCTDMAQFPAGWYNISLVNDNAQIMALALKTRVTSFSLSRMYFIDMAYANVYFPTANIQFYINPSGNIYSKFGVQCFMSPQSPIKLSKDQEFVIVADLSFINSNPAKYNIQFYFQNCSGGKQRIYTKFGGYRAYLGIDLGHQNIADAYLMTSNRSNQLTQLSITPTYSPLCNDTILPTGRYFISAYGILNRVYYIVSNGIVQNHKWQWSKTMDADNYENLVSTNGSKQFWVQRGAGKIHYFRTNNAVKNYMLMSGKIDGPQEWQEVFMGDSIYSKDVRYSGQFYVQTCGDSTYRIYSLFGGYRSYLGVNADIYYGGSVYFSEETETSKGQFYRLNIQPLKTNNIEICQLADAVSGNSATFYMTADPQIGFSPYGRYDGDTNAMNTYDFLVTQIKNAKCPQTFVGIAGDMNHESDGYQNNFHHNDLAAGDKAYFFADLIGKHDTLPIMSKYSMIPKKLTQNPFLWSNAVSIAHQYYLTVPYSGYQSASAAPSITHHTSNSANSYNSYILGLYNKSSANTNGTPVAYYVAIHNNFDDGKTALIQAKNWYNKQNTTVPIILVSNWVNSFADDNVNGQTNMLAFVNSLPVAAILVGHQTCKDAYMNDHCCRRNKPEDHYYANATLKNGNTVPITNSNNRTIPYINTSGVRDRIFFSISLNSTTVQIIRKAWTNGGRYGEFEVDNLKMAPLTYKFA